MPIATLAVRIWAFCASMSRADGIAGPHDRFVCPVVIPRQGGIGEGDPPYGVADHLEAARLVWRLLPGKPDGLRWIARREHRRRPRRLDPPPRPPRRPGHAGRRPGYAPLPDLADPRPPRQPRPAADPEDQPGLALERNFSPAGNGSAPCRHPPDQHEPSSQYERRNTRRGWSRCAPGCPPAASRTANRHHNRNRTATQSVTAARGR